MHILVGKRKVMWQNFMFLRLVIAGLVVLSIETGFAQSSQAMFPDQRLVHSTALKERIYFLTLGPLEKINGKWISDREELLKAGVEGKTYEISHPYSLKSAWLSVQQYFAGFDASLAYECIGLECGSSNAWANERFNVPLLYGLDLSQRYQVWQWLVGDKPKIAVVYLVQRGNQRIYFHEERLSPSDHSVRIVPGASVIAKRFYDDGSIAVPGVDLENDNLIVEPSYIAALAKALNEKPFRLLSVVGFDRSPGSEDEQRQRALSYAQQMVDLLVKKGVRAKRLDARSGSAQEALDPGVKAKVIVQLR